MRQIVVDASCLTAMLLNEHVPSSMEQLFESLIDIDVVVPSLWFWEIANSTLMAARRAKRDVNEVLDQLADMRRLSVTPDDDAVQQAWESTMSLAAAHHLTVYDASYLEVALRRQLPLATLDRPLARAARAVGIEVIGD